MSYDYLSEVKRIENSSNYCYQQKTIEIEEFGLKSSFIMDFLIDIAYDIEEGFKTDGKVGLFLKDSNNEIIKSFETKEYDNSGFLYNFDDYSNVHVEYKPGENWMPSSALLSNVEFQKNLRSIFSTYYNDSKYLFDEYVYKNLLRCLEKYFTSSEEDNNSKMIDVLNKYKLSAEVSSFVKDIVAVYNQSYFMNLGYFQQQARQGKDISSESRFSICISDMSFKSDIENRIDIFKSNLDRKILGKTNVRGDKNKSILEYIRENEKVLQDISNELIYRTKMKLQQNRSFLSSSLRNQIIKECRQYCESFNKNGLVLDEEKRRIAELEKCFFVGVNNNEQNNEYDKIVQTITDRYDSCIKKFIYHSQQLTRAGYDEYAAWINHNKNNDYSFMNYRRLKSEDINHNLHHYIEDQKADWEQFLKVKNNDLNSGFIHQQMMDLEKLENEYAQSDNPLGISKIDFDKWNIIRKIGSLNGFALDLKYSQIHTLLNQDIPALKDVVYYVEQFSGKKASFLDQFSENEKQIVFGSEHYQYLSPLDKLQLFVQNYKKNKEELEQLNLSVAQDCFESDEYSVKRQELIEKSKTFRKILDMMSNATALELKEIESIKNHIVNKNRFMENELAFGFEFEDITTDGMIDLIKTLTQLKRLTDKYELLNKRVAEGDSKAHLQASNVAGNINYIKENIIKGVVETDANVKVSPKDLLAYNALTEVCNNSDIVNVYDELISVKTQIKSKQMDVDGIEYIKSRNVLAKFNISENKKKRNLESEITELEQRKEVLQKRMDEAQKMLEKLSIDLKKSLESSTVDILRSKGMLSVADLNMIETFAKNI